MDSALEVRNVVEREARHPATDVDKIFPTGCFLMRVLDYLLRSGLATRRKGGQFGLERGVVGPQRKVWSQAWDVDEGEARHITAKVDGVTL